MEPPLLDEADAERRARKYHDELGRADLGDERFLPLPALVDIAPSQPAFEQAFGRALVTPDEKAEVVSWRFARGVILTRFAQFLQTTRALCSACRDMAVSGGKPLVVTFDSL
jgi:hypothetical protein